MTYYEKSSELPNQLLFFDRVQQAIYNADRSGKGLAVLLVDLNDFQLMDDTQGRRYKTLIRVGNRIRDILRKGDTVARMGADKLSILAENLEEVESANAVAQKVLEALKAPFKVDDTEVFAEASIGCAIYPFDGNTIEQLTAKAHDAMSSAKTKGKNRIVICSEKKENSIKEELMITNRLYSALQKNELELYYQPQYNARTNKIVGMEALLRWNHPELGLISPKRIIPIAEKTGLIIPIGKWVIKEACMQSREWQDRGFVPIPISVNISVCQLDEEDLFAYVANTLDETGVAPENLIIEITESIAMKKIESVVDVLTTFKQCGIGFSIDDFGTAYSSLNYIKHMPVDSIKIDKSFVDGIGTDVKDEAIINTIISLANNLKLNIIAEGVESKSQANFLMSKGCEVMQGYYFYHPMRVSSINEMLDEATPDIHEIVL